MLSGSADDSPTGRMCRIFRSSRTNTFTNHITGLVMRMSGVST